MLQKAGGLFQLLAETDFGTAYGVKSLYYKSRTANVASAGQIRLARADAINFRNEANSADLTLGVSASDVLQFAGVNLATATDISGVVPKSAYGAKGEILVGTGAGTYESVGVGTNGFVLAANSAETSGVEWTAAGVGDVIGPASSTDNGFVRFDGLTGKLIKDSAATISNADVAAAAGIALNKLAATTASRALVSDGSGFVSVSTTTATQVGYLDTLTSNVQTQLNAKQDTVSVTDTNSIDLTKTGAAISADLKISTANPLAGATNALVSVASDGLQVQTLYYSYTEIVNLSLAVSFAAGAMTVAVKTSAGNDATAANPILIPVRSSPASAGTFEIVPITSALSITVPSGATLGLNSGFFGSVYLSAMNNGGTIELSVNSTWSQDGVSSSTTIGTGADIADNYSTTGRSNLGFRMIGRLDFNTAPNGTWAAVDKVFVGDGATLHAATSVVDVVSTTSAVKTPGATSRYLNMTDNSLTLQPGYWQLSALGAFTSSGGSAAYAFATIGWFAADGADNGTPPAVLSTTTGLTVVSAVPTGFSGATPESSAAGTSSVYALAGAEVIVYVDQTATIFLVPYAQMTTAANARVQVSATAKRIF